MRLLALFFFLLPFFPVKAEELFLKRELSHAQEGSWIVIELNKNYILFHIRQVRPDSVLIEEVTAPQGVLSKNHRHNWKEWFESGARGHTLWTLSEVNVDTGRFERSYSCTHQKWLNLANCSSLMATLLNIRFTPIPFGMRKRIGPLPPPHLEDKRPLWQPKVLVEGRKVSAVPFLVWQARWPADQSELSKKRIEIYMAEPSDQYPSYFPYWLEVEGKIGSAKVRIVDSGLHASSPQPLVF